MPDLSENDIKVLGALKRTHKRGEEAMSYPAMEERTHLPKSQLTSICKNLRDLGLAESIKGKGHAATPEGLEAFRANERKD